MMSDAPLRSGACGLSSADVSGRNRVELDWESATPHVRDAAYAYNEVMRERLQREAVGDEHSDGPPEARSRFL